MEGQTGAIILAGGKSSRMGHDKALLPFHGTSLLEHIVITLTALVGTNIVVVADQADKYTLSAGTVVADLLPDVGPVGGILTGLTALSPGAHLVVACDMPYLNPAVLRLLLSFSAPEWEAIAPMVENQPEPLCAVYRYEAISQLSAYLQAGRRSARGLLESLQTRIIDETLWLPLDPERKSFTNINTPEELARLMAS